MDRTATLKPIPRCAAVRLNQPAGEPSWCGAHDMVQIDRAASSALWYFAYGSNMSPAIFLERRGMHPLVTRRARLDGFRLCFTLPVGDGERGVANVQMAPGTHVWGVAYLVAACECHHLDRTEGVTAGFYERISVTPCLDDGARLEAFTYRSTRAVDGRKPSARYIGLLLDGARRHRLPVEYVQTLAALDLACDERVSARPPLTASAHRSRSP
jgi:gliotoxin/aspirochlorine biosynthesis gamma-glutamylcyclotransferase